MKGSEKQKKECTRRKEEIKPIKRNEK